MKAEERSKRKAGDEPAGRLNRRGVAGPESSGFELRSRGQSRLIYRTRTRSDVVRFKSINPT